MTRHTPETRAALAAWDRAVLAERDFRLAQAESQPLYVFTRIARHRTAAWALLAGCQMVTPYDVAHGR